MFQGDTGYTLWGQIRFDTCPQGIRSTQQHLEWEQSNLSHISDKTLLLLMTPMHL
jgi:hypothetical protein